MNKSDRQIQEEYYSNTAHDYDSLHLSNENSEHNFALAFLMSCIQRFDIQSVLDIGAGTGRTIQFIRAKYPHIKVMGIEPVKELREQAYRKGIPTDCMIEGYGENIPFSDMAFDLVCEFGILHHVLEPKLVVSEMLRVSRKYVKPFTC